jgi:hypothetical protein
MSTMNSNDSQETTEEKEEQDVFHLLKELKMA